MAPWKRTYWVVYAANLIVALGMMSFLPFFPSFLEELGVHDRAAVQRWSGITFGAAPLAAAVMGPVWGSIGDRFSRKLMVLRSMLAITLFVGAMGFARTPWELLILRLLQGVFSGFVPPSVTLVSVAAPREVQGRIAGSLQGAMSLGSIAGPLLGALVRDRLGMRGVFLFVSALSGLSALLVGLLAREEVDAPRPAAGFSAARLASHVLGDLGASLRLRSVRGALLVLFCAQLGSSAVSPQIELFVRDVWKGDPEKLTEMTALVFSAFAVTSLIAMPVWGRFGDRVGHARALRLCALSGAAALGLHVFAFVATETPVERRGSALGAAFSARAFAMSLGSMGGGVLAAAVGLRGMCAASAVLVVLGTLLAQAWIDRPPAEAVRVGA